MNPALMNELAMPELYPEHIAPIPLYLPVEDIFEIYWIPLQDRKWT